MESKEYYNNLKLSEIDFLTMEILNLLKDYNIYTLGQLLGATMGLTNTSVFPEQEDKDGLIHQLLDFIPVEIIEMYRTFSEEHPTGLLKDQ